MKKKSRRKGFTLVEVIVVLVILGILLAFLIPALTGYIKKANITACNANKVQLLRDLTAEEIYTKQAEGYYDTKELQALAEQSEYKCKQGGTYEVSRASDGTIAVFCPKHDKNYNFNMNEALSHVIKNNPDIAKLIKSYADQGKPIDSSSGTGKSYEQILSALGQAGFNASQAGVQSWSLQGVGNGKYYFYWTTEDITSKKPGDKVKVLRYNSSRDTYTAGYVTIEKNTISASDSSDGQSHTYNVLGRGDSKWEEYKDTPQTDKDKKDYSAIYEVFKKM
jgi:prepilin-type N-terminal cleavage/methylation domain-containing protein